MGATTFETYADGTDPDTSFDTARDAARYEDGHGGYTGTIAEKDSYVIITRTLMDHDQAERLAGDLLDRDDPRISDKWGPAGAIPVRHTTRTVTVDGLSGRFAVGRLNEADLDSVVQAARQRGLLGDDTVTEGRLSTARWHFGGRHPRFTNGVAHLTVALSAAALQEQTRPDGWLFFGRASS